MLLNRNLVERGQWTMVLLLLLAVLWLAMQGGREIEGGIFVAKSVSPSEARALIEHGALIVDVRGRPAFDQQHIPGALPVPLEELRIRIPAIIAAARHRPVIVYCTRGLRVGPEGAALLARAGFTAAVNLATGIEGWAASGLPVDRGS